MKKRNAGFTLVELLVVISIIALLVAIVLPAISNAMFKGKLTTVAANGRSIQQSVFVLQMGSVYRDAGHAYPIAAACETDELTAHESSSQYLHSLVTNGVMNVGYNFFTAPGIRAAATQEEFLDLSGRHNAWSVVACVGGGTVETMPFLMTKNFELTSIDEGAYEVDDTTGYPALLASRGSEVPFQNKGMVFVTKGGSAYALYRDDLVVGNDGSPGPFRTLFNVYPQAGLEAVTSENSRYVVLTPKGEGVY